MRRWRLWVACLAGTVLIAAIVTVPETRYTIPGLLRGEQFYSYRPTSYWGWKIQAWYDDIRIGTGDQKPLPTWYAWLVRRFTFLPYDDGMNPLVGCKPSAVPMLGQLAADDSRPLVSGLAVCYLVCHLYDCADAASILKQSLKHAGFQARQATIDQLDLGFDKAVPFVEQLLSDSDLRIRVHAAVAILRVRRQDARAVDVLLNAFARDCLSQREKLFALAWDDKVDANNTSLSSSKIIDVLAAATQGPDQVVRQKAAKLLAALKHSRIIV